MKKILLSLLCVAALLLCAVSPALAAPPLVANANTDTGTDIVVIIDRSGTMHGTNTPSDPEDIALAATNMLVDIADPQSTAIAAIGYGYDIRMDTGFVELSDPDAMDALKAQISACDAPTNEDTNTGKALRQAKDLIDQRKKQHPDHRFAMLLLSDGKIEFNSSDGYKRDANGINRGKTQDDLVAESRAMGNDVANACAQEGITISCLGIYNGNDTSRLGTDMSAWASITGGTYIEINDINETYRCIDEIYMSILGQSDDQTIIGPDGEFDIPAGVSDATIKVVPGTPETNLSLESLDASGNWTDYPLDTANITESSYYTTVRLNWPPEGHYRISFRQGQLADAQLVSINYGRELVMNLSAPQSMRNQETTDDIVVEVYRQGVAYYDPSGNQPVVAVTDEIGQVQELATLWDAQNLRYTASFTPSRTGVYTLRAYQDLNGRSVSNEVQVTVGKASISKASDIGDIEFTGHALHKYDQGGNISEGYAPITLALYEQGWFSDPDGVGITSYEVQLKNPSDSQYVALDYDPQAQTLVITPLSQDNVNQQPASVPFEVYAYGADATVSDAATGTIIVEDLQAPLRSNRSAIPELTQDGVELKAVLPQSEPVQVVDSLRACFEEPNAADGEDFAISEVMAYDDSLVRITVDGDRLLLAGLKEGETTVVIKATSWDTTSNQISFKVRVVNKIKQLLIYGLIALAALILIAVVVSLIVRNNKPRFNKNAVLGVRLITDSDDQEGSCMMISFGRGPAKMTDVCVKSGVSTSGMRKLLETIRIYPRRGSGIEVRYKQKGKGVVSTLNPNDSKDIRLDQDGDNLLVLTYIEEGLDDYT